MEGAGDGIAIVAGDEGAATVSTGVTVAV